MLKMIIDIVRHAETFSNTECRFQGSHDILLSKLGIKQAEFLHNHLDKDYDIIFCSSLKRTQQTLALALGKSLEDSIRPVEQCSQILISDHLREMNLGNLEGTIKSDMTPDQKFMWENLQKDPYYNGHDGESPISFYNRVNQFINEMRSLSDAPKFRKILIFSHNGVIQLIFQHFLHIKPPKICNADIMRFEVSPEQFKYVGKHGNNIR